MAETRYFDQNEVLKNTLFSTFIKSTDKEVNEYIDNTGCYTPGVSVKCFVVNDSDTIIIDSKYVDQMKLKPKLDGNGNQKTIDLADSNDVVIQNNVGVYELQFYKGEDEKPFTKECIALEDINTAYGVDILYGNDCGDS